MLRMTKEFKELLRCLLDWAINAYRSYLNASFQRSTTVTLFAITLLTMAETMHLRYAQHFPEDLQSSRGEGHRAFKIMFAVPVLGVIAIRIAEICTLSQSTALTVCLVMISMMPGEILSVAMYFDRTARNSPRADWSNIQARLQSILNTMCITMQSVVQNSVALALVLGPMWSVISAVVVILEWIMRITHHRLRSWGHLEDRADDVGPEEIPV
ncbi:hypothetical protein V8B97DRAFT_1979007 [Scleroderma yunnanense]